MACYTDTQAILKVFLGHYFDKAKDQLCSDEPEELELVRAFSEVLDGVKAMVRNNNSSVLHCENGKDCNCIDFISTHWPEVVTMEQDISEFLGRHVLTDEKTCWIEQMEYKYKLLYQLLLRQEQDYIDFVEGTEV